MDMSKQMKVIFHTINPVHMACIVVQNAPDIVEQGRSLAFLQTTGSVFGTEDDVIENLCVGTHDRIDFRVCLRFIGLVCISV